MRAATTTAATPHSRITSAVGNAVIHSPTPSTSSRTFPSASAQSSHAHNHPSPYPHALDPSQPSGAPAILSFRARAPGDWLSFAFFAYHPSEYLISTFCSSTNRRTTVTMAGQQQQIMETIFNMKRRLLRKDDCMYAPTVISRHPLTSQQPIQTKATRPTMVACRA